MNRWIKPILGNAIVGLGLVTWTGTATAALFAKALCLVTPILLLTTVHILLVVRC